jgi:type I restriction enzyme S subunit
MSASMTNSETENNKPVLSDSRRVPELRFKGREDNWESLNLKQLIKDLQSGISVNSEDRPIADDSEFGILKTSSVANGVFKKSENKKIVDEEITRAKLNPTENEIIISRMNTPQLVGESGYIDKTYPNLFVPDRLWQTVTYSKKCHNRWLSYFLITDRVRYNLKSIATGTSGTMKNISKPNFLGIKVNCPTLPEQQKIASFLSAVDDKVQQLTKKAALLEDYKKGVMQQLFTGQLRFKAEDGKDYPDWEEKNLGDVATINMGQSPDSKSYNEESIGLFLIQGNADINGRITAPRQFTSEPTKICEIGDIILTVRAPVGSVSKSGHNACIGRGVCSIVNNTNSNQEYLFQFLLSYESKWGRLEQGSTFTAVSGKDIRTLKLNTPSLEEQQKIATYLSRIDTKIESVSTQITQTQTFKKGLLQQMFV